MRNFILALVFVGLGMWSGAALMRYNIAQMFAQGEGRTLCEQILAEAQ